MNKLGICGEGAGDPTRHQWKMLCSVTSAEKKPQVVNGDGKEMEGRTDPRDGGGGIKKNKNKKIKYKKASSKKGKRKGSSVE